MTLQSQKLTLPNKCRYFFGQSMLTLFPWGSATAKKLITPDKCKGTLSDRSRIEICKFAGNSNN